MIIQIHAVQHRGGYACSEWFPVSIVTMTRPFVFLLPGMLCDAAVWQSQIAALKSDFTLAVPVFRGFDSFDAMANHVLAQAPPRFSLVAHSMGGRVAMELLRRVPERVEHFIVMDLGVHPVAPGEMDRNRRLLELAATGGLDAVADSWIPYMLHPDRSTDFALCTAIRAMVLRNGLDDLRGQLLAAERRPDQSRFLPGIKHRVHILCGDSDNWNPPVLHRQMHEQLPDSILEIIPRCGHMTPMEKPEEVNALLHQWLRIPSSANKANHQSS